MKKLFITASLLLVAACGAIEEGEVDAKNFPKDHEDSRRERKGKLTGEDGLNVFGKEKDNDKSGGVGVNSFLWRATLDTIGFMPILTADPFGGVITTDWYEDPAAQGERFKINALILDSKLRSDGVKVTVFKQLREGDSWRDAPVSAETGRAMEDKILTRARELRVSQLGR